MPFAALRRPIFVLAASRISHVPFMGAISVSTARGAELAARGAEPMCGQIPPWQARRSTAPRSTLGSRLTRWLRQTMTWRAPGRRSSRTGLGDLNESSSDDMDDQSIAVDEHLAMNSKLAVKMLAREQEQRVFPGENGGKVRAPPCPWQGCFEILGKCHDMTFGSNVTKTQWQMSRHDVTFHSCLSESPDL